MNNIERLLCNLLVLVVGLYAAPSIAEQSYDAANDGSPASQVSMCSGQFALFRSVFTDEVENRTPLNRVVTIGPQRKKIFFFTEIIGAAGREVVHRWYHNNQKIVDVAFDVKGDRWRTWSSKQLGPLGPGTVRVEVLADECVIGHESVLVAEQEVVDVATLQGWLRPNQALEAHLARQAKHTAIDWEYGSVADKVVASGDTLLTQAIRNHDEEKALMLISTVDAESWASFEKLTSDIAGLHRAEADPFLKAADGTTPLSLAIEQRMAAVLDALEKSILDTSRRSRHGSRWADSIVATIAANKGGNVRFDDGDSPLLRAVRTNNERAVATLLRLGAKDPTSKDYEPYVDLYAYDIGGRQALEIAKNEGFLGVVHLLNIAMKQEPPSWAVLRRSFAMEVIDDEPNNCRGTAFEDEPELHFYAQLADIKGWRIRHEWWHDDVLVYQQHFDVESELFVTTSQRLFSPEDIGRWIVRVVSDNGKTLATEQLNYRTLDKEVRKNRARSTGTTTCEMGLGTMYGYVRANAPIRRLKYLFDKGLKFNPRRAQFKDLFEIALNDGNITLVRWFLDEGFGIDDKITHRKTAVVTAAGNGDAPMLLFLLNRGASLTEKAGSKLMVQAAVYNHIGVVKVLLDHNVTPNSIGRYGATALRNAMYNCNLELTSLLLANGASPVLLEQRANPKLSEDASASLKERAEKCVSLEKWSLDNPVVQEILSQ